MVKPQHEFYIPSVYDETRLSCRIYHPSELEKVQQSVSKGAIIAHPYATLGGSNDDPVVNSAAAELVRKGYIVLTLNFRGASDSGGSTSWTAKPEVGDYLSAYGFMLKYLQLLGPSKPAEMILVGYSYGALVAMHQPKVEDVISLFSSLTSKSPVEEIYAKAKELINGTQEESGQTQDTQDNDDTQLPQAKISYLILSPIRPPSSWFVTILSNLSSLWIQGQRITSPKPEDQLPKHRTLVVYGTDDLFTSETRLRNWCKSLSEVPDSKVRSVEIPFAGHFWIEQTFHAQLRKAISDWIDDDSQ